ncbi:MAG: hypothetical protein C0621_06840 [Desulfuromonas sp.]|nr:MAG: hypothetical protein C0621_06840 [Desulfuromonas sp.]
MPGVFLAVAVVCYLVLLIDWKEMRAVLGQGGWGAVCIYCVLTGLIYNVLTSAHSTAAHVPAAHH